MHDHIHVIDQNPLQVLPALVMIRRFTAVLFHLGLYVIGQCAYLWLVIRLANDKEVCHGFRDLAQVQGNYVLALLILESPYDRLENLGITG